MQLAVGQRIQIYNGQTQTLPSEEVAVVVDPSRFNQNNQRSVTVRDARGIRTVLMEPMLRDSGVEQAVLTKRMLLDQDVTVVGEWLASDYRVLGVVEVSTIGD